MAQKPATVKVLHRALDGQGSDGDSPHSVGSPQQQLQLLKAENESLKQRLEQVRRQEGISCRKEKLPDTISTSPCNCIYLLASC